MTPPSGLKNRLEQAGHPGSPVSPSPLALLSRDPSGEDSTAEVQQAFMSLGLKSKKLPIERTSGQLESKSNEQSESSMFRHEPHQSTSFPADIKGSGYYQHNAEFNVYSTHTPFVTPLRPKNNDLSSADKMSFSSPVAPISNGRNGHWTVHNFTSTTPHKTASKWSVNRTSVGAGRPISGQLFRTSHKRRPETETLEQIDQPSRKHSVSIGESGASAQIRHNIQLEEVDRALLEKLGKEV